MLSIVVAFCVVEPIDCIHSNLRFILSSLSIWDDCVSCAVDDSSTAFINDTLCLHDQEGIVLPPCDKSSVESRAERLHQVWHPLRKVHDRLLPGLPLFFIFFLYFCSFFFCNSWCNLSEIPNALNAPCIRLTKVKWQKSIEFVTHHKTLFSAQP